MEVRQLNVYFFFAVLIIVSLFVFLIFQPFLTAMVAAAILSVLFRQPYLSLKRMFGNNAGIGSLATCILVGLIIVVPVLITLSLAANEANNLYQAIAEHRSLEEVVASLLHSAQGTTLGQILIRDSVFTPESVMADIRRFSENALGFLQVAYQSVTHFFFWIFVMFFTLYYFLIDGDRAFRRLMQLSPLKSEHEHLLAKKFISISRATLKGTLVVGLVQGLLGGLAFWIVGVPSPAIWGLVMVLLSIMPLVGSALVWLPTGVVLLMIGQVWQGVFLLSVGFGVISMIDNILRPKLVGKDTQMHPLLIFFAILGGISFFGLPGFIIGPIIVSLFTALGEIYSMEFRNQLAEQDRVA